eukprot:CAMPEP_0195305208 /NCGR_PEP_ID=MMETSP0707-20130614/35894_1 /TAXON_ID=33640 /ORGANISM="Asterionellopsis glacialis, Strain CCMP134" /LENGTH=700 /DNA_ID=CAMNT_0040369267 /DNA_START=63 /DNA_END=2165 /DNA_ORIENTATION=-
MKSPVLQALLKRSLEASVSECDHYRVHGLAVETDYIISVKLSDNQSMDKNMYFDPYITSKTFSSFRTLAQELEDVVKGLTKTSKADDTWDSLSASVKSSIQLANDVQRLVDSQRTAYLSKVNFSYVKSLAKQRTQIITDILDLITKIPAKESAATDDRCLIEMARAVEHFFLTDVCEEEESGVSGSKGKDSRLQQLRTPSKKKKKLGAEVTPAAATPAKSVPPIEVSPQSTEMSSPVVPMSFKSRRSILARNEDEGYFKRVGETAALVIDEDKENQYPRSRGRGSTAKSSTDAFLDMMENNPMVFFITSTAGVIVLRTMSNITVTIDTDIAMLMVFASFCLGIHMPLLKQETIVSAKKKKSTRFGALPSKAKSSIGRIVDTEKSSRMVMKKVMSVKTILSPAGEKSTFETFHDDSLDTQDEQGPLVKSPLPLFPDGAELGSEYNCWSPTICTNFKVRGPSYLTDKKKVPSENYIFTPRGVDLFLTDLCPENVGSNSGIMGGQLRDESTFIINLRLPWGVLLLYASIPERFLPFLKKRYEPNFDDSQIPSLDTMTPGDRTVARFFLADDDRRSELLKLIPTVVRGPWVVKSVVGGKPAIIGKKVPVAYVYQPPVQNKAPYFEVDMDVAASSAARRIVSVARSATTELTVDIGFVIQAELEDELPEQMLFSARLHGLDPVNCSNLPPMKNIFIEMNGSDDED